ncbi:serine hydrolase [Gordonia sp. L191]|uniref:serine hydrolase n=1 Tax=Gordonia sp. L191 TaxID=2982699 RepID=UPI0024BF65D6|nr:serine hydrolase [Gordonia sp. L191]WHU47090.1 serine hydrolase [Gordonia sp. L191]
MIIDPVGTQVARTVAAIFADAGCAGWVHARVIGGRASQEIDLGADHPVVMASVYKLTLAIAFAREVDAGEIDASEQVLVDPRARQDGPTGLSLFGDPVSLTWRDLVTSMMVVSDNAAADVVLERVGLESIAAVLADAHTTHTTVVDGVRQVHARLVTETGTSTVAEAFAVLADTDRDLQVTAYDAAYTSATTPRDCTRLLDCLWRDVLATPESSAWIRRLMAQQVSRSRIASGFSVGTRVCGKTGTIGPIRNEVAVIEHPEEYPIAVAVFTRSARGDAGGPRVDVAIGAVARAVVTALRTPRDSDG